MHTIQTPSEVRTNSTHKGARLKISEVSLLLHCDGNLESPVTVAVVHSVGQQKHNERTLCYLYRIEKAVVLEWSGYATNSCSGLSSGKQTKENQSVEANSLCVRMHRVKNQICDYIPVAYFANWFRLSSWSKNRIIWAVSGKGLIYRICFVMNIEFSFTDFNQYCRVCRYLHYIYLL